MKFIRHVLKHCKPSHIIRQPSVIVQNFDHDAHKYSCHLMDTFDEHQRQENMNNSSFPCKMTLQHNSPTMVLCCSKTCNKPKCLCWVLLLVLQLLLLPLHPQLLPNNHHLLTHYHLHSLYHHLKFKSDYDVISSFLFFFLSLSLLVFLIFPKCFKTCVSFYLLGKLFFLTFPKTDLCFYKKSIYFQYIHFNSQCIGVRLG